MDSSLRQRPRIHEREDGMIVLVVSFIQDRRIEGRIEGRFDGRFFWLFPPFLQRRQIGGGTGQRTKEGPTGGPDDRMIERAPLFIYRLILR